MKNILIGASITVAAVLGYLIGGQRRETKTVKNASAIAKAQQKARKERSKRQQRPAKTAAASLAAVQRMTKRSRKKDAKLLKTRNKR